MTLIIGQIPMKLASYHYASNRTDMMAFQQELISFITLDIFTTHVIEFILLVIIAIIIN